MHVLISDINIYSHECIPIKALDIPTTRHPKSLMVRKKIPMYAPEIIGQLHCLDKTALKGTNQKGVRSKTPINKQFVCYLNFLLKRSDAKHMVCYHDEATVISQGKFKKVVAFNV